MEAAEKLASPKIAKFATQKVQRDADKNKLISLSNSKNQSQSNQKFPREKF